MNEKTALKKLREIRRRGFSDNLPEGQLRNQAIDIAIVIMEDRLSAHQLTLNDLRLRIGKPVYITFPQCPKENRWDIIENIDDKPDDEGCLMVDLTNDEWENADDLGIYWFAWDKEPLNT